MALLDTNTHSTTLAIGLDWRVLAFTTGLSLLTCLLFGLAPALNATRVSASSVMRATGRGATSGREAVGLRRALVVVAGRVVCRAALRLAALRAQSPESGHDGSGLQS